MKTILDDTWSRVPRAFLHPLWWTALVLLVLNDHVLKGAGIFPSALTGKLSDVAGLIVAPPLCVLALGAGRAWTRMLGVLAVGLGFCAVKLSPDVANALGAALGALGIPSRFWADPSDLWALAALPLGFALSRPGLPVRRVARGDAWLWAGVVAGALGCIATGGSNGGSNNDSGDAPAVQNDTDKPLTLVVASTDGAGGCKVYRSDRVAVLSSSAFVAARELTIDPGEQAPLTKSEDGVACGAASIRLSDGNGQIVYWHDLASIESFVPDDDSLRLDRRVTISGGRGHLKFKVGDDLARFEPGAVPPDATCDEPKAAYTLEWTPLLDAQSFLELSEVRKAADGCYELDWFRPEGDTTADSQRLCVPKWAIPFKPGEQFSVVQQLSPLGERMLRITRYKDGKLDVQLVIWNDSSQFPDSRAEELAPVDCFGSLAECGAYTRPLTLKVHGVDDPLRQGEDASVDGDTPKETRILLGPGRDVAWTTPTCLDAYARLGPTANVLELRIF